MDSTYKARLTELRKLTGAPGTLEGTVTVDQVYAHYQHERLDLHHPRGGTAMFLTKPLMAKFRDWLEDYARTVLNDGGLGAMKRSMEDLSDQVEVSAPREWGDLMKSGHPQVTLSGHSKYDRPPKVHRLTAIELKAKSQAIMRERLAAGLTVYFMRHGKVMVIPGKNDPHPKRGRL